ncbi:MAG: PstS family phosphate ABC transporter substrate-binding protein [Desulfomonilaceae bacterium]
MSWCRNVGLAVVFAILINGAVWSLPVQGENSAMVHLSGSRYLYFTVTDLARRYMEHDAETKVIVTHADQQSYVQSLMDNTSDAIMTLGKMEQDLKEEAVEQGIHLQEKIVAWGGVVLVTDPKNPVNELTMDQVRKIFLGEHVNWAEVGGLDEPIVTMSRDEAVSGTERFFREFVLHGFPLVQQTVKLFDPDIVRAVWKRRGSIADARYTEAVRGRIRGMVKIIALKEDEGSPAIMPSVDTIEEHTYPLSAPQVMYYDVKSNSRGLKEFVDFCADRGLGTHHAWLKKQR